MLLCIDIRDVRLFSSESATSNRRARKVYIVNLQLCFLWEVDDTCEDHEGVVFKQPGKRTINLSRTKNRSRTQCRRGFMLGATSAGVADDPAQRPAELRRREKSAASKLLAWLLCVLLCSFMAADDTFYMIGRE